MKKKIFSIIVIVLVLVLALFVFTACNTSKTEAGINLVQNSGFEEFTPDEKDGKVGKFDNWKWSKDWKNSSYGSRELDNTDSSDGGYADKLGTQYLELKNDSAAYVYLYQEIEIDRKAIYEISIDIRIADIKTGTNSTHLGAYVSFLENVEFIKNVDVICGEKDSTGGEWVTKTFFIKPLDTDYLTICVSLGGENKTVQGTSYFDNVTMKKVDKSGVPAGKDIIEFRKNRIARYNISSDGVAFVVLLALLSVALLATAYIFIRRNYASKKAFMNFDESTVYTTTKNGKGVSSSTAVSTVWYKNKWFIAAMLLLGTFLIRLIALLSTYGMGSEMDYLVKLARYLGKGGGVANAYGAASVSSFAPGSLYILAIMGAMGTYLPNEGVSILIRMVGVLADIAVVLMIYFYGRKYVGNRLSTIYAALYSALPITFIMSGINGSFVSLLVALMLGAIILVVEKQYLPMYLVMSLAIVLDIRALAIAPILVGYMGYMYYKDSDRKFKPTKNRVMIIGGLAASFVLIYILTIPAAIHQIQAGQAFFGYTALANTMTKSLIFVQNAINLYAMVGMNMKTSTSTVAILNLLFLLVLELFAISLYVKNRNKQEIFLISSFALAVIAVFTIKVDFTYLFLALAIGFVYTMISGDRRMYAILSMYSVLGFLAIGQLMNNSGYVAVHATGLFVNFESTSADLIIFSVLSVLTTLYYAYVTYSITNNSKISDIRPMFEKFPLAFKHGCIRFAEEVKYLAKRTPKSAKATKEGK